MQLLYLQDESDRKKPARKYGGRHGQESKGDQDQEGREARVGDEAQYRASSAHDRRSSEQADQETRGHEGGKRVFM